MVTLRDVAEAAGVSPATASRALSHPGRVTPVRRARVERAAAELGYRRVSMTPAPRRLGLVLPDLHNPYFSGVTKGIQHRARLAGLSLLIADSDEDPRLEVELVQQMGILDRLRQRGTLVPEQVCVVGFDDVPAATYVSPALTTVQVPLNLLGRIAVDLLISPGSVPDVHRGMCRMPVSLVVRGSTGPVAQTLRPQPQSQPQSQSQPQTGSAAADLRAL